MKIAVVIPDDRQLVTAGVRIRYNRLAPGLETIGHSIELVSLDAFRDVSPGFADVVLFSKCHDARALALAGVLRRNGIAVGVDVFDDYYSDPSDSRFVHIREWIRALSANLTFAMSSTSLMSERLGQVLPGVPRHVLHDPSPDFDPGRIGRIVESNLERTLSTRKLDICWFGIGDNPHFEVGLSDLHDFGGALADIRAAGFEPRLSILTNRRALDVDRLEMIARLPVRCRLEVWSEPAERETIAASLFCFLPVRTQNFSVVKSLNRAVTALTGGSQAMTSGYPLYGELRPFIYERLSTLITDVEAGALAMRAETAPALLELLSRWGGPAVEAERLVAFLDALPSAVEAEAPRPTGVIVHGRRTTGVVHKFGLRLGHLSVASPFAHQNLNFDLRFVVLPDAQEPAIVLSKAAAAALRPNLRAMLTPHDGAGPKISGRIVASALTARAPADFGDILACRSSAVTAMRYRRTMEYVADVTRELFGDVSIYLSELESPLWADVSRTFALAPDRPLAETGAQ